ncbi:MAG: Bpu10I family restriction endonuclease [Planctomycetaceae bacterium]|jgi:hypothetical protein|nr:Bpu10I family restriction endonuclease [Planctomycetaceae bacterium]
MAFSNKKTLQKFLQPLIEKHVHASNIAKKLRDTKHSKFLFECADHYKELHDSFQVENVAKMVKNWNIYLDYVREHNEGKFSAQSKFEPTILEESVYRMFSHLENEIIKIGTIKAYSNLYFSPVDFESFQNQSRVKINTKDQDFSIYKKVSIQVSDASGAVDTFIPVVAMECKTYLDKTMLEGSIATAEKIKQGNPYCRFCIITEFYDVDKKVDVKHSRIDQIYVFRKNAKRKSGMSSICHDVVKLLYDDTVKHLEQKWSDVEKNIKSRGVVL